MATMQASANHPHSHQAKQGVVFSGGAGVAPTADLAAPSAKPHSVTGPAAPPDVGNDKTTNLNHMHDLVIRAGTVIDGTGQPGFTADIAVNNETITEIGNTSPKGAES